MADTAKPLRLLAQDAEDLAVLSAALQDAIAKIGDIRWDAQARTLTIACNRFRWEAPGKRAKAGERVRSALQFGDVTGVQARNLRRDAKGAVVELLSIAFEAAEEAPAGVVTLTFAGGGDMRVAVDCLDVALADVSDPWSTPRTPGHAD
ncbi:DUF2948 family protein [Caulobacter sp. BP25]|jgi:hypothetical protein|uniref:DUF2948 family protein n=1 Tax=Caulobacter sp. BP25 TaxID=2048900 RepID=UPI000C12ABBA|nr:DUF2948 family protein [Caulobacter sp. BP25]PHY17639.1 hypothetical protein CSW59_18775 [Caulobacter sp. BP25]